MLKMLGGPPRAMRHCAAHGPMSKLARPTTTTPRLELLQPLTLKGKKAKQALADPTIPFQCVPVAPCWREEATKFKSPFLKYKPSKPAISANPMPPIYLIT